MNHHDHDGEPMQGGMQTPQNIDAELSVLARIMLSRDALGDAVEMVQAAWFWRPAHERIFSAATRLFARGAAADPLSVAEELRRDGQLERCGGLSELHRIVSAGLGAGDLSEHAAVVRDAWLRREIARTSMDATARAVRGEGTAGDILGHVQAEFLRLGDDDSGGQSLLRVGEGLEESLRLVREAGERPLGALTGTPTGFTDLDSLTQGLQAGQLVVIAGRPAMGKALALDTPLPTPTGWTTMGAVQVGDMLLGEDGRPTRVVAATEVMTGRDCFEVEFSDGSVIVADGDHQWLTHTRTSRRRSDALPGVRTTREIARGVLCGTREVRYNHSVKVAAPVVLPEADLLVGPYTLGAWLGDGHAAAARITTPDLEVLAQIEAEGYRVTRNQLITYGIRLPERAEIARRACVVCGAEFTPRTVEVRTCGRTCGGKAKGVGVPVGRPACEGCGAPFTGGKGGLCMACHRRHGTLQARLRTIGVLGNKRIPQQYLRASEEQRRALLAGLLDTDGYCTKGGTVQFAVVNERLARDVRELVASLGYKPSLSSKPARLYGKDCGTAWTVTFTPPDKVFRLARKAVRQRLDVKSSNAHRYITAVRQVESVPVRCVEVDNASHLYLAGEAFIPTHNSTLGLDLLRATSIRHLLASAFFSLEMSRHEINLRMLSAEARVGLHHLRSGRMEDDDWARLARRMPEVAAAPLFVDDSPDLDLLKIRAKARRMRQQHDLSLVVVDYLQLMRAGAGRFANRQEEVSEISRSLKLLAKELEVPVVALSQLNRGPEQRTDKKPMVSDLRESGAIEQDADIVILLHREDAYNKESPRSGEADLIVAKHRNGPTATITVAFQGHYSRFMDMAQA